MSEKVERIPNDLFRAKYEHYVEREELTLSEVAYRMDYTHRHKATVRADTARVSRLLGYGKEGLSSIRYKDAVNLCKALHIDPWEVGL